MRLCVVALLVLTTSQVLGLRTSVWPLHARNQATRSRLLQMATTTQTKSNRREVTWRAHSKSVKRVTEAKRPLERYMSLPPTEYSVLDASKIDRIGSNIFECTIAPMNFFGNNITPRFTVSVDVDPEQCKSYINVIKAETFGSDAALMVNGTFDIYANNTVHGFMDEKGHKALSSEVHLEIHAPIPESSIIPTRVIETAGGFVIQSTLSFIVYKFVQLLAKDFAKWSQGDDNRGETGTLQ